MSDSIWDKSKWNAWIRPAAEWNANPADYVNKSQPDEKVGLTAAILKEKYADLIASDPIAARKKILDELLAANIDWHKGEYKDLFDMLNSKAVEFTDSDSRQKNIVKGVCSKY